jgi:hypothetical protein
MLAGESSARLESTRAQHRGLFAKERLKEIVGTVCGCASLAVVCAVLGMLRGGWLIGAALVLLICVSLVIYQLFRLATGPPSAKTTPEATLKLYLEYCVLEGRPDSVGMDGYGLLLGSAQRQFQDSVQTFEEYWLDANYAIRHELAGRLGYGGDDLLVFRTIKDGGVEYRGKIARCLVHVSFAAKLRHYSPFALKRRRLYEIGQVQYHLEYELGRVGDGWYVATPKWDSAVVKVTVSREGKWS